MDNNIFDKQSGKSPFKYGLYMDGFMEKETYIIDISEVTHQNVASIKIDGSDNNLSLKKDILKAEANAAFICKAVNNYDSLLEALKEINETYRGITDLYMNPSQKAAHKKVNDTLISIEKAEK